MQTRNREQRGERRLRFEALETRRLLTVLNWIGEGEDDDDCDCGPVNGPDSPYVRVLQVDATNDPLDQLTVHFSDSIDAAALIGDGSITSVATLVHLPDSVIPLTSSQFAYDDSAQTLTISLTETLGAGVYELRLDGNAIHDADGHALLGGRGGVAIDVPNMQEVQLVEAAGAQIEVGSYSVPTTADWNNDGRTDLIVGEKTPNGEGKIRVYLNAGNNSTPQFDSYFYVQSEGGDLVVPASGCMGVFPRVYDWNADGKKDLVLGLANGTVQVAVNASTDVDPTFYAPSQVQVGATAPTIGLDVGDRATPSMVDWNNDGRPDLVVGALNGTIQVFIDQATSGAPSFLDGFTIQDGGGDLVASSGRSSVDVADLNGDGLNDLVVGNTDGQLLYYANLGTSDAPAFSGVQELLSDFATVDLEGTPRSRPFVTDFNNDGQLDLLVGAADGLVRLYAGAGNEALGTSAGVSGEAGEVYAYALLSRSPLAWQNSEHPLDVNNDGALTPLDALSIINYLNQYGAETLPDPPTANQSPPPYYDCNGDGDITPIDALMVINDLNNNGPRVLSSGGEGEANLTAQRNEAEATAVDNEQDTIKTPANASANTVQSTRRLRFEKLDGFLFDELA